MRPLVRRGIPGASPGSVAPAMLALGLNGIRRSKGVRTTIPGKYGRRTGDLLDRDFSATAPNRSWVMDFTHVGTWAEYVYVLTVVDVFAKQVVTRSCATSTDVKMVMVPLRLATRQHRREGHRVQRGQLIGKLMPAHRVSRP